MNFVTKAEQESIVFVTKVEQESRKKIVPFRRYISVTGQVWSISLSMHKPIHTFLKREAFLYPADVEKRPSLF